MRCNCRYGPGGLDDSCPVDTELGVKDIAVYANGFGGTPYIATINFVLPDNPFGDTPELYYEDMIHAGYDIGNRELVQEMAQHTVDGYELLCRWGVTFAHNEDGSIKLRHVSGHTHPRSLCQTTELIGGEIMKTVIPKLEAVGVKIYRNCQVVDLLTADGTVEGIYRSGEELEAALAAVGSMLKDPAIKADSFTEQSTLAIWMILQAALNRKESRGTHNRLDYPKIDPAYEKEFTLKHHPILDRVRYIT